MRTFAQRPEATQHTTPAKSTIASRGHFGQSREVDSILSLQRTIGNQAAQRLLQAKPDKLEDRPGIKEVTRFPRQVPLHPTWLASMQGKLVVSSPGDTDEQEADRVSQ